MTKRSHYNKLSSNSTQIEPNQINPEELPEGSMKIPLSKGLYAIVDSSNFDQLNKFTWSASTDYGTIYALRGVKKEDGKTTTVRMHKEIMGVPPGNRKIVVDHINGNGLDNRLCNLRVVTSSQNQLNRHNRREKQESQYLGVVFRLTPNMWQARIRVDNKLNSLGYFDNEVLAAEAYDKAALEIYGPNAETNERRGLLNKNEAVIRQERLIESAENKVLREKLRATENELRIKELELELQLLKAKSQ